MTATLLDGELLAARIRAEVTDRVARLRGVGVTVGLGTILVGDDGPSARYVAMKHADCDEVGIASAHAHLPADVSQDELDAVIAHQDGPEADGDPGAPQPGHPVGHLGSDPGGEQLAVQQCRRHRRLLTDQCRK